MHIVAFILAVVAAAIFLFVPEGSPRFAGRSGVAFGLAVLTVALIVQFCATSHTVTF